MTRKLGARRGEYDPNDRLAVNRPGSTRHAGSDHGVTALSAGHVRASATRLEPSLRPRSLSHAEGVDLSHWNPVSDWGALANGQRFVILKATQHAPDPAYQAYRAQLDARAVLAGFYHYLELGRPGAAQADLYAATVGDLSGYLPPIVDVEQDGNAGVSAADAVQCLTDFLDRVASFDGRRPIVYSSRGSWAVMGNSTAFSGRADLWVAHHKAAAPALFGGWTDYLFWQYDIAAVDGCPQPVDVDRFNGDQDVLRALAGRGPSRAVVVSGVVPVSGVAGDSVAIQGSGFNDATGVSFGEAAAKQWSIDDDTAITAVAPQTDVSGPVVVSVSTPGGASGDDVSFTYTPTAAPPALTAVDPVSGVTGDAVVIAGSGLSDATGLWFGSTTADSWSSDSDTQISATVPDASLSGPARIAVESPAGTSSDNVEFTYLDG